MKLCGCSVRATIDRYKKASSDSSNTVSTSEANAQVTQINNVFIFFTLRLYMKIKFQKIACIKSPCVKRKRVLNPHCWFYCLYDLLFYFILCKTRLIIKLLNKHCKTPDLSPAMGCRSYYKAIKKKINNSIAKRNPCVTEYFYWDPFIFYFRGN